MSALYGRMAVSCHARVSHNLSASSLSSSRKGVTCACDIQPVPGNGCNLLSPGVLQPGINRLEAKAETD